MRGAPHAHILLWLVEDGKKEEKQIVFNGHIKTIEVPKPAPCFRNSVFGKSGEERIQGKKELLEFIESIVSIENNRLATRNIHGHSFTCQKGKKKVIKIQPNEGHGKFKPNGENNLLIVPKCRFGFPRFPMPDSRILEPMNPLETSEKELKIAAKNFKKIQKFIIRQTFTYRKEETNEARKRFFELSFEKFLWHLDLSELEYCQALQSQITGRAKLFLKRDTSQIFINNYNINIMETHDANMDISIGECSSIIYHVFTNSRPATPPR